MGRNLVLAVVLCAFAAACAPFPPAEQAPPGSTPAAASSPEKQQAASQEEAAAIAAAMQQVARAKTDYHIGPADLIGVTVYQDAEMSRKVRVNANGTVSLPLVGPIKVGGKTLIEAQTAIEEKLATYLKSPQVSLFIEDYGNKLIFVMGEVQKPGSIAIPTESKITVVEAISSAGGFTAVAAQDRTRVLRNVNGQNVTYYIDVKAITQQAQKDKDMVLEPNDIVYVPQSFF
ncbi:MAG: polysaccharide export protein [Elusimicrobia bacterium]|nr:polysaccharide export protein [Elusimicrobiota bacterium]